MSFLQALFGSQYYEIQQRGRDGNKGRLNANLFLSAMLFLVLLLILFLLFLIVPGFEDDLSRLARRTFGSLSGRSIGKIVAIPVFALLYGVTALTVGSPSGFKRHVAAFMEYPETEKKKANRKLLVPFFVLLIAVVLLAVLGI